MTGRQPPQGRISKAAVAVARVLRDAAPTPISAAEVARRAAVPDRTARHHLNRLGRAGLVETVPVVPSPRYRLVPGSSAVAAYLGAVDATAAIYEAEA